MIFTRRRFRFKHAWGSPRVTIAYYERHIENSETPEKTGWLRVVWPSSVPRRARHAFLICKHARVLLPLTVAPPAAQAV